MEELQRYENYTMGPVTVTTDKGTSIEADIVFKCTGLTTNSDAYKESLGKVLSHYKLTCLQGQFGYILVYLQTHMPTTTVLVSFGLSTNSDA